MKEIEPNQPANSDEGIETNDPSELMDEELGEISGGIILVSGKPNFRGSHINFSELNPQPLPPGPPDANKLKGLGNLGSH